MKNLHMLLLVSICGLFLATIFLAVLGTVEWKKYKNNHPKDDKSFPKWKKYIFAAIMCFILFFGLLAYLIINNNVESKHSKFGGGDRDQEDEGYVPFTLPPIDKSNSKYDRPKRAWSGYWVKPTSDQLEEKSVNKEDIPVQTKQLYPVFTSQDYRNSVSRPAPGISTTEDEDMYQSYVPALTPQNYVPSFPAPVNNSQSKPQVYPNSGSVAKKEELKLNKPKPQRLAHYTENPVRPLGPGETSFMDREEVVPKKSKFMGSL